MINLLVNPEDFRATQVRSACPGPSLDLAEAALHPHPLLAYLAFLP
jgi:hypothetical protein